MPFTDVSRRLLKSIGLLLFVLFLLTMETLASLISIWLILITPFDLAFVVAGFFNKSRYHARFISPVESVISPRTGSIRSILPTVNELFFRSIYLIPADSFFTKTRVSSFLSFINISLKASLLKNLYSNLPTEIVDLICSEK